MKLFGRTGGYYLFWTGAVYFAVGMYCIFVDPICPVWLVQAAWIAIMCLPFVIPPFGRWLNMSIDWDIKMFNWFKKADYTNVVPFPSPLPASFGNTLPLSEVKSSKQDEEAPYTIGINPDGKTQFRLKLDYGYVTLTMTPVGVIDLIEDLAHTIRKEYTVDIIEAGQGETSSE